MGTIGPPPLRLGALVLAAFFWSTSFPAIRWGLETWSPMAFAFWRFGIASLGVPVLWRVRNLRWDAWRAPELWGLAALNALGYALQFWGQQHTLASRTALLINLYVLWIPLLQVYGLRMPLSPLQGLALVPALGGLVGLSTPFQPGLFWGDVLVMGASWVWAFYILILKESLRRWSPLEANGVIFAGSVLFLAPLALLEGVAPPSGQGMVVAVYLAVVCTWMAYLLYTWGLEATSPFLSSLVLLLEVAFAWALSILLLGETWHPSHLVGALLLGLSLVLAVMGDRGGPS